MPVVQEPVELKLFEQSMISAEMERLFNYILQMPEHLPVSSPLGDLGTGAHIDDAADLMDLELTDEQLSAICEAPAGPPVTHGENGQLPKPLHYSCELRKRLFEELMEIEFSLPHGCEGWLTDLLEGKV